MGSNLGCIVGFGGIVFGTYVLSKATDEGDVV